MPESVLVSFFMVVSCSHIRAMTRSPLSASSCRRKITTSPSRITGIILSPRTLNAAILSPQEDLANAMNEKGKHFDNLRVRVIAFRDYIADKENAMLVTDFFSLPAQAGELSMCIKSIVADGGGDEPEDALEALAYAMKSDWMKVQSSMRRQVIVLWTDAAPHPIGFAKNSKYYPKNMPSTLEELSSWWGSGQIPGCMDEHAKRLILFAPESKEWIQIVNSWNNSIFFPSETGEGLQEYEYQSIIRNHHLNMITGSYSEKGTETIG